MGGKPKAEGEKRAPRRKMTQAEQSALFAKTARELGIDETGEAFERLFDRVVRSRQKDDGST